MVNFFHPFSWTDPAGLENELLYRPYRKIDYLPSAVGLPYEDVNLRTADGIALHAWFLPAPESAAEASLKGGHKLHGLTLLYCHGNGGNISHRLDRARLYHRLGLQVLFFDYRGYGQSEGVPNELGTYADAEAARQYLVQTRRIAAGNIVLYGESLGAAIALETALRHRPRALILESAFTSTVDMAKRLVPQLPVESLIRNRYDNYSKIATLAAPLLVMHSPADQTVPYEMGRKLFEAAPDPKRFVDLKGSHYLGYHDTGPAYPAALEAFLRQS